LKSLMLIKQFLPDDATMAVLGTPSVGTHAEEGKCQPAKEIAAILPSSTTAPKTPAGEHTNRLKRFFQPGAVGHDGASVVDDTGTVIRRGDKPRGRNGTTVH
jgi:hypothetical protein